MVQRGRNVSSATLAGDVPAVHVLVKVLRAGAHISAAPEICRVNSARRARRDRGRLVIVVDRCGWGGGVEQLAESVKAGDIIDEMLRQNALVENKPFAVCPEEPEVLPL